MCINIWNKENSGWHRFSVVQWRLLRSSRAVASAASRSRSGYPVSNRTPQETHNTRIPIVRTEDGNALPWYRFFLHLITDLIINRHIFLIFFIISNWRFFWRKILGFLYVKVQPPSRAEESPRGIFRYNSLNSEPINVERFPPFFLHFLRDIAAHYAYRTRRNSFSRAARALIL